MRPALIPSIAMIVAVAVSACATRATPPSAPAAFFSNLATLCGQTHAGRLVVGDPALDKDFAENRLKLGPVACSSGQIAIPFAVGDDQSRTWIVTRTPDGVRLKHRHAHGAAEDALSQYGGDSRGPGEPTRQDFPADAFSVALFQAQNRAVSVTNVWTLTIEPGVRFVYALRRPGRHVEVEFPLSASAEDPR